MRYAGLIKNDMIDGEGFCVSYWAQGCPHHCPGCHNPETWDFNRGIEINLMQLLIDIDEAIEANGITRNFSILGGEPLCEQNVENTNTIGLYVKNKHPNSKIFVWTGYELEDLISRGAPYNYVLEYADTIIDGRYLAELRDVSLHLRGSSNQRILNVTHKGNRKNIVTCEGEIIYGNKYS